MDKSVFEQSNQILTSFQTVQNEEVLFQVAQLFPVPIQIFTPDGNTVFASRAVLELWNIREPSQIVGKYNLLKDPVVNDHLGLREQVRRAFAGEIVLVPDVKVPLEHFSEWYESRNPDYDIASMYTDILNFPIFDANRNVTYIVSIFITTRTYFGKSDVARAKEYLWNHWLDEFNLDHIAEAANMSRYHFARVFKKHTGMTPYGYYQDIKIQKIKDALRNQNLTITEAFACCGVEYCGSIAGVFKQKVGMTPSQYRKTLLSR